MGKFSKNKISPDKGKSKTETVGKQIKSVKNDPFFVTSVANTSNSNTARSSNNTNVQNKHKRVNSSTSFESIKPNKLGSNLRHTFKNTLKKTFKKRNNIEENRSKFVTSPSKSGTFFVREEMAVKENDAINESSPQETQGGKKPFDKKKWRMQKYSKKYKLEQWEEKRKKAVLRHYYKDVKQTDKGISKIYEQYNSSESEEEDNTEKNDMEENENNLNNSINMGRNSRRSFKNDVARNEEEEITDNSKNEENIKNESDASNSNFKNESEASNSNFKKRKAYKKAHEEYQRIKEEKKKRREELEKKKAERDAALKIYKQKKVEKFKRLNKKTKRGQPVMKDRIEMLLEQIQKNIQNN